MDNRLIEAFDLFQTIEIGCDQNNFHITCLILKLPLHSATFESPIHLIEVQEEVEKPSTNIPSSAEQNNNGGLLNQPKPRSRPNVNLLQPSDFRVRPCQTATPYQQQPCSGPSYQNKYNNSAATMRAFPNNQHSHPAGRPINSRSSPSMKSPHPNQSLLELVPQRSVKPMWTPECTKPFVIPIRKVTDAPAANAIKQPQAPASAIKQPPAPVTAMRQPEAFNPIVNDYCRQGKSMFGLGIELLEYGVDPNKIFCPDCY